MESQNVGVLDNEDDDGDDDGIGDDIADEVVVKMPKGTQLTLAMDLILLDMLDWGLHVEHGQCHKLDLAHYVNDIMSMTSPLPCTIDKTLGMWTVWGKTIEPLSFLSVRPVTCNRDD